MMTDRKEYVVTVGGLRHRMLLDDADAERYGERAVEVKQASPPVNKARAPRNKSDR